MVAAYTLVVGALLGGVDEGEDERTALNREFMEEAGIDISVYPAELIHESHGEAEKTLKDTGERVFAKMNFHTYKVVMDDKNADEVKVVLDDEHAEYRWSDPSELHDLKLTPPSVELFTKSAIYETYFSLRPTENLGGRT